MNLTQRIEERLSENKTSVKTYAQYERAVKEAEKIEKTAQNYASTQIDLDYVVVFLPTAQRWTCVFMYSSFLRRAKSGGYVGWIADAGFFTL